MTSPNATSRQHRANSPEIRARLARWLSGTGPVFYLTAALTGRQRLPPGVPPDTGAAQVAAQERRRVLAGELYWVSAAMTRLARHAAQSLPSWNLYRHDLPSDCGLMVFEQPLGSYTNDEAREVEIVAASWGPRKGPGRSWANDGVALSFYSHPAPVLPRAVAAVVRHQLRRYDLAGRFGGDEIMLLFPGTTARQAEHITQRLCTAISTTAVPVAPGLSVTVTVSAGISQSGEAPSPSMTSSPQPTRLSTSPSELAGAGSTPVPARGDRRVPAQRRTWRHHRHPHPLTSPRHGHRHYPGRFARRPAARPAAAGRCDPRP